MVTLAEAYAEAGVAPPKGKRRHPEWSLQTKIVGLVREFVACEHEFAAHDRGFDASGKQHLFEAERGIRRSWLDTELVCAGGLTFRCELKWGRNTPDDGQARLISRLNALGHPAAWANSIAGYVAAARVAGVPFHPSVDHRAAHLDAWLLTTFDAPAVCAKIARTPSAARTKNPSRSGLNAMARSRKAGIFA